MTKCGRYLVLTLLVVVNRGYAGEEPGISHGPMLGAVSERSARIWVRATDSAKARFEVFGINDRSRRGSQELLAGPPIGPHVHRRVYQPHARRRIRGPSIRGETLTFSRAVPRGFLRPAPQTRRHRRQAGGPDGPNFGGFAVGGNSGWKQ